MSRNWKARLILVASAVVGATAVAFASDLISTKISDVSALGIMNIGSTNDDACPPNACSIVMKANKGSESTIIDVH